VERGVVTVVSFRLGGADGVAVEARKWAGALGQLGFTVRRVAGEIQGEPEPDDVVLPWLAIGATDAEPDLAALADALDDSALVIVENMCSLPLNLTAARAVARVVAGVRARVVFHDHDLPSQRRAYTSFVDEFPPRVDGALHVTVNLRSRRELESHGLPSVVALQNRFDLDAPPGDRDASRSAMGFDADDLVVFQPSRAIERKNVPGGLRFAQELGRAFPDQSTRYWLSGPAEDGYDATLDKVLARATVPVTLGRGPSVRDAYAASDVVVFPSTWEGFGNPTIESIVARRPLAAFNYPVLAEILATGLRFFSTGDPRAVARFLREPETVREQFYAVNLQRARLNYSLDELPAELDRIFRAHGWETW
jgi:glycosyltransferase involved in cell wall biosynthesis